eukprot:7910351-Pyramimonas_sp.AAC.1
MGRDARWHAAIGQRTFIMRTRRQMAAGLKRRWNSTAAPLRRPIGAQIQSRQPIGAQIPSRWPIEA